MTAGRIKADFRNQNEQQLTQKVSSKVLTFGTATKNVTANESLRTSSQ